MSITKIDRPDSAILTLDDDIGFVALVDRMQTDASRKVVNAARISYEKCQETPDADKDRKLASFLWAHGHTSPYRHSFYTFHWKAPLFVFRQAFKYQVGSGWREYEVNGESVSLEVFDVMFDTDKGCSWNEVSGRYVQWTPEFYVPAVMRSNPPHGNKQASVALDASFDHAAERARMTAECEHAFQLYQERIERGVAKEIARMCLPQNLYSQAYWTVSLQGVIHFLEQRLKADAQFEIRRYAQAVGRSVEDDLKALGIELEGL
ncbi:MAG: FAD-dependent thymidylate synthase [Planctomycetes bacterium]|nr:FAD-dependent thymidylate synthase [Planctomycetota bacterium]MCB9904678.1 FAD-dependent thymidylate synthase [Planctomycetota bacterium]